MKLSILLDDPIGFALVLDEQGTLVCFRTDDDEDLDIINEFVSDAEKHQNVSDMSDKWIIDRLVLKPNTNSNKQIQT